MNFTLHESDAITAIKQRYENMHKRFAKKENEFPQIIAFLKELQLIHQCEYNLVIARRDLYLPHKNAAEESHCNPSLFFKHVKKRSKFQRFWREFNNHIFDERTNSAIAEARKNTFIAKIDVGYHCFRTGHEKSDNLLNLLAEQRKDIQIKLHDNTILMISSMGNANDLKKLEEAHSAYFNNRMIPVSHI